MRLCAHLFLNLRAGSGLVSGAGIYSIESGQKWASQSLEVNKDEVLRLVEAFTDPTPIFEKGMTTANVSSFSIYIPKFEFNISNTLPGLNTLKSNHHINQIQMVTMPQAIKSLLAARRANCAAVARFVIRRPSRFYTATSIFFITII